MSNLKTNFFEHLSKVAKVPETINALFNSEIDLFFEIFELNYPMSYLFPDANDNNFIKIEKDSFFLNIPDSQLCFWYIHSGSVIINYFDVQKKLPLFRIITLSSNTFLWGISEKNAKLCCFQARVKPNTHVYKIEVNKAFQDVITAKLWDDIVNECNEWIHTFTKNIMYIIKENSGFEVTIKKGTNTFKNGQNIVSKQDNLWIYQVKGVESSDGKSEKQTETIFSKIKLLKNNSLNSGLSDNDTISYFPITKYKILSIHHDNMSDHLETEILETKKIFKNKSEVESLLKHISYYHSIILNEIKSKLSDFLYYQIEFIQNKPENILELEKKSKDKLISIWGIEEKSAEKESKDKLISICRRAIAKMTETIENQMIQFLYILIPFKLLEKINTILTEIKEKEKLQDNKIQEKVSQWVNQVITKTINDQSIEKETFETNEDNLLKATKMIAHHLGLTIRINTTDYQRIKDLDVKDQLNSIARSSNFRFRAVKLENNWFNKDQGPILAFNNEDIPIALIPYKKKSYIAINTNNNSIKFVDRLIAQHMLEDAYIFYCPFPESKSEIDLWFLLKFGLSHLKNDLGGVIMIGVLIGILSNLIPFVTAQVLNTVIPFSERELLNQYAIALIVGAFASFCFEMSRQYSIFRIQTKMEYCLQTAVWDRLLKLPLNFFRHYSAGELAENVSGISKIRDMIAGTCVSAVFSGTSSFFLLIMMFYYSIQLSLACILLTFCLICYTFVLNYVMLINQTKEIEIHSKLSGFIFELMRGISKIRVNAAEIFAFNNWVNRYERLRHFSTNVEKIDNSLKVVQAGFPIFSNIILFSIVVYLKNKNPDQDVMSTGEFVAFLSSYSIFLSAMLSISDASLNMFRVKPVYDKLKPILKAQLEIDENAFHPGELTGKIEAKNMSFRYSPNDNLVLKDISFSINPGEFVAFVGESGSGKSTLLKLLLGLEKPDSGVILYNDQDLSNLLLQEVRNQIGVVMQSSQVRPTTIFENIAGISSLTEEEAWQALEKVDLKEFIKDLPMELTTLVSENGSNLSGGQKQRLMIASAIAKNPKIIFLDEATSSLDNETQKKVIESLEEQEMTRITIAHRLSTIEKADNIYVLDNGKIVNKGNYKYLMEKSSHFQQLAVRQRIDYKKECVNE